MDNIVDGVDMSKLEFLKDMMKDKFAGLANTYGENQESKVLGLRESFESKNYEESFRLLHGLKGSSASLGAVTVAKNCAELEEKVSNGQYNIEAADIDNLESECKKAIAVISQFSRK